MAEANKVGDDVTGHDDSRPRVKGCDRNAGGIWTYGGLSMAELGPTRPDEL